MPLLEEHFRVYAVDLRGQGRSTRTPGRYTLDNMGNDLVRFIALVIRRPRDRERAVVGRRDLGLALCVRNARQSSARRSTRTRRSSPPRSTPSIGQSLRQSVVGPMFASDEQVPRRPMEHRRLEGNAGGTPAATCRPCWPASTARGDEPSQTLKEYDPEWGAVVLDRARCGELRSRADARQREGSRVVHPPLTHVDETTGRLIGAISDLQAARVVELVEAAGQPFDYQSFPTMGHSMHGQDPQLFTDTVVGWADAIIAAQ